MRTRETPAFVKAAGGRAKKRRLELDLALKAVAFEAGYTSHTMLSAFEHGLQMPTSEKLVAIARVLRVSVDWILGVDGAPEPGIPPEALAKIDVLP